MLQKINEIEELLVNAFPAVEREIYDGWILNYSGGYTYRANCIYPFYHSSYELQEKIDHCERHYRAQFLPAVYKMTLASEEGLDALLEKNGYQIVKKVDVLYRELDTFEPLPEDLIIREQGYELIVMSHPDEEWLAGVNTLIGIPYKSMRATQSKIFTQIKLPSVWVKVRYQGKVIGTGLGVLERHYIGLYAIHVSSDFRRKGIAVKICTAIMARGKKMGAERAHLQVRRGNDGALLLYEKLGLHQLYEEWFRMKSWSDTDKIFD